MDIINVSALCFSFGARQILENACFTISESDKCGLIGVNGSGKSTLFKLLAGEYAPDSGTVRINRNYSLGFLKQDDEFDDDETIGTAVRGVFKALIDIEEKLRRIEDEISASVDEAHQADLIRKYDALRLLYDTGGGYEYQSRIRGIMKGLDIGDGIFDETLISTLSEGQKARLSLALALANPPDVLLLDEPTNHLDILSLEWLEEYLISYKKCFVVISHDRYFIDKVTTKIIELENRSTTTYGGNYSYFLKKKSEDRQIQQRRYDNQQKEIARMEAFIEQQLRWNRERNIVAAESRQKAIDRLERIDKPKNLPGKISLRFRKADSSGNDVLYVENVSKSYGDREIFKSFSSVVRKNERIFIIGPNGCGKTTFMRTLVGELTPDSGDVEFGHRVKVGYFDQRLSDLDGNNTVLEEALKVNGSVTITEVRDLLGAFLFSGDDVMKRINTLSGGEKGRVALAKLILSDANLLLLDEPTNHLDINSREAFEASLKGFDGTIIAISHDRYFINNFATRIFYFHDKEIVDFREGYEYYILKVRNKEQKPQIKTASALDIDPSYKAVNAQKGFAGEQDNKKGYGRQDASAGGWSSCAEIHNTREPSPSAPFDSNNKREFIRQKEARATYKRLLAQLKRTEEQIEGIELRLSEIDAEMVSDNIISDHVALSTLLSERMKLSDDLEACLDLWGNLSSSVDELTES